MKRKVPGLLLIVIAFCILPALAQKSAPSAVLRGTVRDLSGAVFPNAKVTIKTQDFLKEIMTSPAGEYSVQLTPGIYNLEVDTSFLGFSTAYRAPVNLPAGKNATIDFILYSKASVAVRYDPPPAQALDDVPFSEFKYEQIGLETKQGPRSGMLRYGVKDVINGETWYKSGSLERGKNDPGVTFTYNFLTVTATGIRFDVSTGTVFASGRITIENGSETKTYDRDARIVVDGETTIVFIETAGKKR